MLEVVVRRVDPIEGSTNWPFTSTASQYLAQQLRDAKAHELMCQGFRGKKNAAGVWRLSKWEIFGVVPKRVRVSVFIRPMPVCQN